MGNPIKMDDLGVPLFLETPRCHSPFTRLYFFGVGGTPIHLKEVTPVHAVDSSAIMITPGHSS